MGNRSCCIRSPGEHDKHQIEVPLTIKPEGRIRRPLNFDSAHQHFLWKLNNSCVPTAFVDHVTPPMSELTNWRRRIYYLQYEVPVPDDPAPAAHLLYGSEKDEKVVELLKLSPGGFRWDVWEQLVKVDESQREQWRKGMFNDEQYELAFLQRKTNLDRKFPEYLYPFTVTYIAEEGGEANKSLVLAAETAEDREMWRSVTKEYMPKTSI